MRLRNPDPIPTTQTRCRPKVFKHVQTLKRCKDNTTSGSLRPDAIPRSRLRILTKKQLRLLRKCSLSGDGLHGVRLSEKLPLRPTSKISSSKSVSAAKGPSASSTQHDKLNMASHGTQRTNRSFQGIPVMRRLQRLETTGYWKNIGNQA